MDTNNGHIMKASRLILRIRGALALTGLNPQLSLIVAHSVNIDYNVE